jgi:hypothetical protein
MKQLAGLVRDVGEYSYASGRCRAIINKLRQTPRETHQIFEAKIEKELEEFENKLIKLSPGSLKNDLELFLHGKREVNQLKIQLRKYHRDRKRREGIKVLKLSRWGKLVDDKMSNKEVEIALDKQWFRTLKSTTFREFIIDLEQLYEEWYRSRNDGKKFDFDPMPLVNKITSMNPLGWGIILRCYYTKLKQIENRRKAAWGGY